METIQINVMDVIITEHTAAGGIFQKFGENDNRVFIVHTPELQRTSLYVNLKKVGETIKNITFEQLAELQKEAFEYWKSTRN